MVATVVENLVLNPSGVSSGSAWSVGAGTGGAGSLDYRTGSFPIPTPGTAVRFTWSTAPSAAGGFVRSPVGTVTAGVTYTGSIYGTMGTGANRKVQAVIRWLNSSGTQISSSFGSTVTLSGTGDWERATVTDVAPALSVSAFLDFAVSGSGSIAAISDTLYACDAQLEVGSAASAFSYGGMANAYPETYGWEGTPYASASIHKTADSSLLTVTTSDDPPSAHLVFEDDVLPYGTHTLEVVRSWDSFSADVRGWSAGFADGGAVVDDFEIPLGVTVTYTGEAFDSGGVSLGAVDAVTASISSDPSIGWISDPTDQTSPIRVELKGDFAGTLTRVRQVQTYQVGNRVVALLGALGKLSSIPLRVQTKTLDDAAALSQVLQQTSILIRTAPPTQQPRLLYVVVPQVDQLPQNVQYGDAWTIFDMTGDEVDSTTLDILVPVTTYQTYMDAFALYSDIMAAYDTYFDEMKNPPS